MLRPVTICVPLFVSGPAQSDVLDYEKMKIEGVLRSTYKGLVKTLEEDCKVFRLNWILVSGTQLSRSCKDK